MDFDKTKWRITRVNVGQKFCQTYPELLIVKGKISDDQLLKIANFRSSKRFSAVVWKSKINDCKKLIIFIIKTIVIFNYKGELRVANQKELRKEQEILAEFTRNLF